MEATFRQISTEYVRLNISDPDSVEILRIKKSDGMNILGIIVVCIGVGISLSYLGDKGKPLADIFISLDHVIILLVRLLMWYAPIGIASIIAAKIIEIKDLTKTFQSLSLFMGTVILGLLLHLFVTISIIYFIASRKSPLKFLKGLAQAAINALGTSSSAASLPITFQCLEKNGISSAYTKFVLPVGAVVNMDGTALYEAVAAIFIAQINGINLSFAQVITVSITATLASIGTAAIPSGGLVTLVIVLSSIGLPVEDISIIFAVDWLLGRLRACVNICGDAVGCAFVQAIIEPNYLPNIYHPKDVALPNIEDAGYFYSTEEVDSTNVCKIVQIAYLNNFEELKEKCKQILIEKKSEIDQTKLKALPKDILFDVFCC
uniref:Amino acid transporter n=1 Tax=Panagrolaimus sp. ES5 TaxID=591445 RepID=A0AC34F3G8_9BILA